MIYPTKPKDPKRWKWGFAFLPKRIGNTWIWLEYYQVRFIRNWKQYAGLSTSNYHQFALFTDTGIEYWTRRTDTSDFFNKYNWREGMHENV